MSQYLIGATGEYEVAAMKTAKDMGSFRENLIHAALGLASDSGEFVDAVKKHCIYGKELDRANCIEELGDILWFVALACNTLKVDMLDVMDSNIRKLNKRYPGKYTDQAAIARADKTKEVPEDNGDYRGVDLCNNKDCLDNCTHPNCMGLEK